MPPVDQDSSLELTDRELRRVMQLVYQRSGITLHEGKRALIIGRLHKRVREAGFRSFDDYLQYVENERSGLELTGLLDAIATNHTSFFREPQHFSFLSDVVLPPLMRRRQGIEGWSAACSTGEEPYTLAMTCAERVGLDYGRSVRLLASDLSSKALSAAQQGIYKAERVQEIPTPMLRKYFEKGSGGHAGFVRVSAALRRVIEFRQMNLLELPVPGRDFDFIFCRNVMIYFDLPVRQRVVSALERRLRAGGYLFTSHAESLNGVRHGLRQVAPAVYVREER